MKGLNDRVGLNEMSVRRRTGTGNLRLLLNVLERHTLARVGSFYALARAHSPSSLRTRSRFRRKMATFG
jgi:hypothetical protein